MEMADGRDVLSLVVLDGTNGDGSVTDDSQVLVSVRDPANNRTHPGVVSVPTIRLPAVLGIELRQGHRAGKRFGSTELFDPVVVNSWESDGHSAIIFVVKALLCQKLGVADALESEGVLFSAGVAAGSTGWSCYEDERPSDGELIRMTTLVVSITRGVGMFATRTSSYSDVMWCKAGEFLHAARTRDVSGLGHSPLEMCIHGLCIATAHDVLASRLGREPYRRGSVPVTDIGVSRT